MPETVCREHGALMNKVEYLCSRVSEIKNCLTGDMGAGKTGLVSDVKRNTDYVIKATQTKSGFLDWLFRAIVGVLLVYIAAKCGLK